MKEVDIFEFFKEKNLLDASNSRKVICPYHSDKHPSAILNSWGLYCFTCNRSFSLKELESYFQVKFIKFSNSNSNQNSKSFKEPLFYL